MKAKLTLAQKLIMSSIGLVLVPVLIIGIYSLWRFATFSSGIQDSATTMLEESGAESLQIGANTDKQIVSEFINGLGRDCIKLSESGNLTGYLEASKGENQTWNEIAQKEARRILDGINNVCVAQQQTLQSSLDHNLAVAGP
jgi:hypothetical protein